MKKHFFFILSGMLLISSISFSQEQQDTNKYFIEEIEGLHMKFVYVEGGRFMMGGTSEQGDDTEEHEKPIRRVTLDSYYMGVFEVTQRQWELIMGTNIIEQRNKYHVAANLYNVGPNFPMTWVTWEEAEAFCRELSRKTGKNYRLPTEAEWEYAARGGKYNEGTKYCGSNFADSVAHYDCGGDYRSFFLPVGSKKPNSLGIYDMSGNAHEWCRDRYGTYQEKDTINPTGASEGTIRVQRGGYINGSRKVCRVSFRAGWYHQNERAVNSGFRIVLVP